MENIDSEKIKALLDNEELMKKLSIENSAPLDYVEAFKTAGVELSEEEAQQIKERVAQAVANPDKVLRDAELESVSGGGPAANVLSNGAFWTGVVMGIAAEGSDVVPKDRKIMKAVAFALVTGSRVYDLIKELRR